MLRQVQRINSYQTSDGQIFATAEMAERHQGKLNFREWAIAHGLGEQTIKMMIDESRELSHILKQMTVLDPDYDE